ncbi:unnamed protein product [Sphenostylis stenocarpa]|uniref:Uncharacterized protein n=1 Tax=Sphenostylis stenocarpa TaxID=92480 RepID=A0AA86T796_9FABA|nr:unnamed protein product [Sphenostylis stenocarpa]
MEMNHVGRSRRKEQEESSFCGTTNTKIEYLEAFRTKSYVEICNKAQEELGNAGSASFKMHLTEYLLEPPQEIVANMKVHRLLVDYFEASLETCRCCDTILQAIHQTRLAYARLASVVKLNQTAPYDQPQKYIHTELSSFVLQNNPLSTIIPEQFRDVHHRYIILLRMLTSKKEKIQRTLAIKRVCKKVGGIGLVVSQSLLLVALLVFAVHSIVGLVAAPCMASFVGLAIRKRFKRSRERLNRNSKSMRLCEQLDVAAKGVFVLINELDTMSRMVKRLDGEVEHCREVAGICVKNGKCEILKRVVKEFQDNESSFLAMLEELEEHIYLCFLTVNRSRRLVMKEITEKQR